LQFHNCDSMAGEKLVASRDGEAVGGRRYTWPYGSARCRFAPRRPLGKSTSGNCGRSEAEQRMINLFASANLHKLPIQTSEYCN
jgi:hypothetical protein